MKKRWMAVLLLFAIVLSPSCRSTPDEPLVTEAEATEAVTEPMATESGLLLVKNTKSDYVIVCNFKDAGGKTFADEFVDLMFSMFGVSFAIKSESSSYEKEIVIGETERAATAGVKAQLENESDFAVCAVEDDLVLYATDEAQYRKLLVALRDYIFAGTSNDQLLFTPERNFIAGRNPDKVFSGSEAIFVKNGISSFSIIYGATDSESMTYAIYLKEYFNEVFGISVPILADSKTVENEIIVKGANRASLRTAERSMESKDDFTVSVMAGDIVISATDQEHMVLAMMKLVEWCAHSFNGSEIRLDEIQNYLFSKEQRNFEYSAKELCTRYQAVFGTYSTYHEDKLYNASWVPQADKDDQKLVSALIERMGNAFAVTVGSSSVLYDGFVRKLDKQDYTRVAIIENGRVMIPVEFANSYFGEILTEIEDHYVDLTAYVETRSDYSLYLSADQMLAIVIPAGVRSFENPSASDGKYTNARYCERMLSFFHSAVIPEPGTNAEQSRVVVEYMPYPEYALDFKIQEYQTTYSPSIVVVKENGISVYYVSYEISTVVNYEELATFTVVKKSEDGGNTWTTVVEKIPDLRWASIFENKGVVYLLGSHLYNGRAVIVKVGENGNYEKAELFEVGDTNGTAPGAVLHANGRIYKAYHVASISAPEEADLMKQSSWTLSNRTDVETLAPSGGEGSMVLGKDGSVYQVMHTSKTQTAYVLKLSSDGTTYTATNPASGNIVDFPTCISKTSVIYDAVSGKYIALSNICNTKSERQRNVLALLVSDDLYTWEIAEYILVEREMINPVYSTTVHAFQYTDFKIDGDDIVMVVREAAGYANTYHDGNYTTFYRISDFRELLDNARGGYPT